MSNGISLRFLLVISLLAADSVHLSSFTSEKQKHVIAMIFGAILLQQETQNHYLPAPHQEALNLSKLQPLLLKDLN